MTYSANEVSIQPGGKPEIGKFLRTVMNAGEEVLYPNPGYPIYESQIEFQGGIAVPYGFVPNGEGGLSLNMDVLSSSITPKTKVLIYNNYHNPTGAVSSRVEMEAVAQLALKNDLWVLADEAYFKVLFDEKATSIAAIMKTLRERRDAAVVGLKSIEGVKITAPERLTSLSVWPIPELMFPIFRLRSDA